MNASWNVQEATRPWPVRGEIRAEGALPPLSPLFFWSEVAACVSRVFERIFPQSGRTLSQPEAAWPKSDHEPEISLFSEVRGARQNHAPDEIVLENRPRHVYPGRRGLLP